MAATTGMATSGWRREMRTGRMKVLGALAIGGKLLVTSPLAMHGF